VAEPTETPTAATTAIGRTPVAGQPIPRPGGAGGRDAGAGRRDAGDDRRIRFGERAAADTSRTSPRMRFDVLQLAACGVGLGLVVAGLVAVARTGFRDLGLFTPVVEVGGRSATPLAAGLWLLLGLHLLAAGSGTVAEQRLRLTGLVLGVLGVVFLVEPAAFVEPLAIEEGSGTALLAGGALLVTASFVPPVSLPRPGVRGD
jgi:hypothetical protein